MNTELTYRWLTVSLLFMVLFLQTFSKLFVVADYYTHTNQYAIQCENKNKPQMHCNGKCQMLKKIQQEENKDEQNSERKADNKSEVIVYTKSAFTSVPSCYEINQKSKYNITSSPETIDRNTSIFRPPQTC